MMRAVLGFNQQLERVAEVTVVVLVGALLPFVKISLPVVVLIAALILVLRPFAVQLSLIPIRGLSAKVDIGRSQRWLISWFGVRGIGSIYYLFFSINHGLSTSLTTFFTSVVVGAVATSIVVHGISVTPLMKHYENRSKTNLKP
jgi:NhaP-type Na+/H+ or K+/H+ antiporter